jgi:hypothetical protein
MNSIALSKPRNSENVCERSVQRSTPKLRRCAVVMLGTLLVALGPHHLRAQVGNENPTGHAGTPVRGYGDNSASLTTRAV